MLENGRSVCFRGPPKDKKGVMRFTRFWIRWNSEKVESKSRELVLTNHVRGSHIKKQDYIISKSSAHSILTKKWPKIFRPIVKWSIIIYFCRHFVIIFFYLSTRSLEMTHHQAKQNYVECNEVKSQLRSLYRRMSHLRLFGIQKNHHFKIGLSLSTFRISDFVSVFRSVV